MIVKWRKLELTEKVELGDIWVADDKSPDDIHKVRKERRGGYIDLNDFIVYIHRIRKSDIGKTVVKLRGNHVVFSVWRAVGLIDPNPKEPEPQTKERKITPEL